MRLLDAGSKKQLMCEIRSVVVRTRAGLFCPSNKKNPAFSIWCPWQIFVLKLGFFLRFSLEFQSLNEFAN